MTVRLLPCVVLFALVSCFPVEPSDGNAPVHPETASRAESRTASRAEPSVTTGTQSAQRLLPLGVFEDANRIGKNVVKFEEMLIDLRAHGLDTVLFTNNKVERDEPLLNISDRLGMNVFFLPTDDFNKKWWPDDVPANIAAARAVAKPIIELLSPHPSLAGYIIIDEPFPKQLEKVKLMTQAVRELDPTRPVLMTLIGKNRVGPIFQAAQPDVLQIDVYPAGKDNPPCDFTLTGFAYTDVDFVSYIRLVTAKRPQTTPLWMIMQTHSFDAGIHSLREPSASEVRMQNWLAIGEGATGLYWFVYSTQQSWIGLKDNEVLYEEVTNLVRRVGPLRPLLLGLHKGVDQVSVSGPGTPYSSTLTTHDDSQSYAVVVNRDCLQPQKLTIHTEQEGEVLYDIESGATYPVGIPIQFEPGDGRLFKLIAAMD